MLIGFGLMQIFIFKKGKNPNNNGFGLVLIEKQ